jgi:hypothetical protein
VEVEGVAVGPGEARVAARGARHQVTHWQCKQRTTYTYIRTYM